MSDGHIRQSAFIVWCTYSSYKMLRCLQDLSSAFLCYLYNEREWNFGNNLKAKVFCTFLDCEVGYKNGWAYFLSFSLPLLLLFCLFIDSTVLFGGQHTVHLAFLLWGDYPLTHDYKIINWKEILTKELLKLILFVFSHWVHFFSFQLVSLGSPFNEVWRTHFQSSELSILQTLLLFSRWRFFRGILPFFLCESLFFDEVKKNSNNQYLLICRLPLYAHPREYFCDF